MKICDLDTETTGIDPIKNDIVSMSLLIEVKGEEYAEFHSVVQPFDFNAIDLKALSTNGFTIEQLHTFPTPREVYTQLTQFLGFYINKFDSSDKLTPSAFNGKFDTDFLKEWFNKNGDVYYGSWFNYRLLDPLPVIRYLEAAGVIYPMENHQLKTIAEYFGFKDLKAHNVQSDTLALRYIRKKLSEMLAPLVNSSASIPADKPFTIPTNLTELLNAPELPHDRKTADSKRAIPSAKSRRNKGENVLGQLEDKPALDLKTSHPAKGAGRAVVCS